MIIFNIPYDKLDNLFLFYSIYKASCQKIDSVILYINTQGQQIDLSKLYFLNDALWTIGLKPKCIIDINIPYFYQCLLFRGKILGDCEISPIDMNINGILEKVKEAFLLDLLDVLGATIIQPEEYIDQMVPSNIRSFKDINYIKSNDKNINHMIMILQLFCEITDDYERNTQKLKQELIRQLNMIPQHDIDEISETIDLFEIYNDLIQFRKRD